MADRLQVTELDFDQIKTNLKNFMKQQTEFVDYDFEGSGLNILLDVLAYNTHYNAYYLNMIANETFMESAMLRSSVVSHAKAFGYTPRSLTSPRAVVRIEVETGSSAAGTLVLPKGFILISDQIDDRAYTFVTLESYSVTKIGTKYTFNNIPIYEGKLLSYSYTHTEQSNPKQIFELPESNIDTTTITVSVRSSSSNTDTTVYSLNDDALDLTSTSEVYFIQEALNGNYEIYFGDGILGKKLSDGSVITLTYLTTNAAATNQANLFKVNSTISGFSNITVTTLNAASGGAQRETIEQIKFGAPLNLLSQNRAVTKNDYIRLIQQKYPSWEAVNVWGGEENTPPVYGKVFISGKPRLGFEVTDTEKEYVKNEILKPISILTVTPEVVDIDYNYLKVEATVYYNKAKTTKSEGEIRAGLTTTIQNFCDENLNQFNSYFKYSGLKTAIDNYDRSINSNQVDLFIGKKFRPVLNRSDRYVLDFGVELKRGSTNDSFYSSPDFTMQDEFGISRQCFFEEIPSSFTGLESVTILNPGFGYTSTPEVEIIGDGSGAKAVAEIVNGKLYRVNVTNPGIGYTTAAIRIIGGGGSIASASAVLEGRYGAIRIAYFKQDEVSSQSTKVVINTNKNGGIMGEIDYVLGKITLNEFMPTAINNFFGDITLHMKPAINIIQSKLNKMLVLDADDTTSIVIKTVQI